MPKCGEQLYSRDELAEVLRRLDLYGLNLPSRLAES
jgi:hypothetical protein